MLATILAAASLLAWLWLMLFRAGFWRVRLPAPAPEPAQWPQVVAIVPARDEAALIAPALASLLQQEYPGPFHVIVVDDHSADGTAQAATTTARRHELEDRLTVVAARDLPTGWTGKVWAQAEGIREQQHSFPGVRYVLLTDADIEHDAGSLRDLVASAEAGQYVLASEMVRLRCESLAEKALVPAFVFFFAMLYPFALANNPASKVTAAAGGCMLVRTDKLAAAGGIASIRNALIDDCALAAKLKRHGPIRLDLSQSRWSLRPYPDAASIWNMIARSAYTQLRHSPLLLCATVVGMLWLYVAPVLLALMGAGLALPAWLLMAALYIPMLRHYRRTPLWALALPLVALFYLGATLASAVRYHGGKGGQWKGRAQASTT